MRAPGRTPEAVLNRTTTRRAATAAGAVLLLVTSATANPSTPPPVAAVPPAVAAPPGPSFALPGSTFLDREEHAATRGQRARTRHVVRVRHTVRARPAVRKTTTRAEHGRPRTVRHRPTARIAPGAAGRLGPVVAYARAQIGDPYVFGADGPGAWDCSGLTEKSYAQIGIRLPHSAAGQARRGVEISRSQARPGDLVVWGTHHVGIYAGRGRVLHAPRPGKAVRIATIWGAPTFRRITRRG